MALSPEAVGRDASAKGRQYLTFDLAGEAYGVEILKVQEIRGWQAVRELPEAPAWIKGVMDLRGQILPVMDLRLRLGIEPLAYSTTTVVIVLSLNTAETERLPLGIVVDAVSDVVDVLAENVKPPPRASVSGKREYLRGILSGERMVMLLDADKLIAPAILEQLQSDPSAEFP